MFSDPAFLRDEKGNYERGIFKSPLITKPNIPWTPYSFSRAIVRSFEDGTYMISFIRIPICLSFSPCVSCSEKSHAGLRYIEQKI